jgi:FkbM family methyltransferase
MSNRLSLVSITKRSIARMIERSGYELRRISPRPGATDSYYKVSETCQIRELTTLYELFFGQRSNGFFVEVGAFDGESFSNSSCLADRGWAGLMFEPVPAFAQQCRRRHATNADVHVVEVAVGADDGEMALYVADALTTADAELLEVYRSIDWARAALADVVEICVQRRRLDDLLTEHNAEPAFDLLVIDVEGGEQAVFDGFDLSRWRPTMLIVELSDTHPDLQPTALPDRRLAVWIADQGYCVVYRDQINAVFVRRDAYLSIGDSSLIDESSSIRW